MNALYYDPVAAIIVEPLVDSIEDVLNERLCPSVNNPADNGQLTVWFAGNQSKLVRGSQPACTVGGCARWRTCQRRASERKSCEPWDNCGRLGHTI